MKNYNNGQIYAIYCNSLKDIYIGSTTQKLSQRLAQHRHYVFNHPRQDPILTELLLHNSVKIKQLEKYQCDTIEDLKVREYEWKDLYANGKLKKPTKITIKKTSFKLSVTD